MDIINQHMKNFFSYVKKRPIEMCVIVALATLLFISSGWAAPRSFPADTTIRIEDGTSVTAAGKLLESRRYINSSSWFSFFVSLYSDNDGIFAGDYYFAKPIPLSDMAYAISRGEYGLVPIRVTIPEGYSVSQIAQLFDERFSLFDSSEFTGIAQEGYLFPDTYFFLPNADAEIVVKKMMDNFNKKVSKIDPLFASTTRSREDVVKMASILEREGNDMESRRMIADVLWRRLDVGMPLQVDAAFNYVNGKHTYTLTSDDLFDESPYNTYRNKGLPPTPISNPGLDSIVAALTPIPNENWYFLSDLSGKIYYAKDFDGHQKNRERYLRK
jgi:UPF0755 protein